MKIPVLLFMIPLLGYSQDYRFSQYYNAPILLNPAMTGNTNFDYRLMTNYRNQWSSISNAFKTFSASFDMPMFEDVAGISKLGMGLSFMSDKAGTTNYGYSNIDYSIAYHFKTTRYTRLSGGLLLGYGRSKADLGNVKWESQHNGNNYDPSLPSGETGFVNSITYIETGAGILWTTVDQENDRDYEIGVSVFHVNFPNHSYVARYRDRLRPKIQVHAAMDFEYDGFMLRPKLLLQNQGPAYSFTLGSLARFRLSGEPDSKYTDVNISSSLDLGVFYKYRESVMLTVQYEYKRRVLLAFSYDILIGGLSRVSPAGGYEIALQYNGLFSNKRLKIKKDLIKEEKDQPRQKGDKKAAPNIRM